MRGPRRLGDLGDVRRTGPFDGPVRERAAHARHRPGRAGGDAAGAVPRAVHRGPRHAQEHRRGVPAVLRVRTGPGGAADAAGRGAGAGHHGRAVPQEGRRAACLAARAAACADHRRRRRGTAGHPVVRGADGRRAGRVHRSADLARRHGPAALHQRHHRHAEGRRARPRGGRRALRDRRVRPRSAPGRRVLVHRRPRLGHRHVVRDRRAADARGDGRGGRGRLRRPPLVPHPRRAAGHRLVHRPYRPADADADHAAHGPVRPARLLRPHRPALRRVGRRAAQPGGRAVGAGRAGASGARQLVADRDRRHHDRELRGLRDPPRLDGTPAARGGGHGPAARRGRPRGGDRRPGLRADGARRGGRAGAAARLALDVPRLSRRPRAHRGGVHRRLVPHR